MKTLVIVVHPDMKNSVINKRWVEELQKYPDTYTVHQLYACYPDEQIDVPAEQHLIEQHDKIVFQFPFYWFSSPPLLKKWFDEVLTHGWAYGSKSGYKLAEKTISLAITVGGDEDEYREGEKYGYTMQELLRPFELTFDYIKADYKPFFAYYGLEFKATEEWIEKSVALYLAHIDSF
ncbi:NAD(P)H-dependent oxidoreductase [Sphingobacterium deserti]|uniref:NAD(P)H dehydrogenase (Quinone) n=1 Tax=Sphingobacterium deserti TaxID=1229276 RepID=A0A0B8T6S9_9SPHI|nr:NAD(P)H-dependent oxidoreductase [Sphingobacterium deserti]KGE13115.1 NAD(P)H dehydrogenase (quinone) [Sphingobacterium deserti]